MGNNIEEMEAINIVIAESITQSHICCIITAYDLNNLYLY